MKIIIFTFFQELFRVMLGANLIFLILELIKPGSVLAYLNPSYWLLTWFLSVIILLRFKPKK